MFTNKKGLSAMMTALVFIVAAVIFGFLYIFFFSDVLSKEGSVVELQISGIQGDADKDSIRNFFDKCPCTFGDSINDGCPINWDIDNPEIQEKVKEDVKKYNSEPVCGIVTDQTATSQATQQANQQPTQQKPAQPKPTEQKSEPAALKTYQSIEIFGDGIDEEDLPHDGVLKQACTGWVGQNCPSEDNDCDGKFNLEPLKESCWVMASEDDDTSPNDCGQAKVDDGKIIPLQGYRLLQVDNYLSVPNEDDSKNLFQWAWKSKPEYGALICNKGFWYGCKEASDGRTLEVAGKSYKCTGSEWIKK